MKINLEKGIRRIGTIVGSVSGVLFSILTVFILIESRLIDSLEHKYEEAVTGFIGSHLEIPNAPEKMKKSLELGYTVDDVIELLYRLKVEPLGSDQINQFNSNLPNRWSYVYPQAVFAFSVTPLVALVLGFYFTRGVILGSFKTVRWVVNGFLDK